MKVKGIEIEGGARRASSLPASARRRGLCGRLSEMGSAFWARLTEPFAEGFAAPVLQPIAIESRKGGRR